MDRLRISLVPMLLGSALLLGCGNDGGDTNTELDASAPLVDAMNEVPPDAEVNYCTILEASYGDLGALTGVATIGPQEPDAPMGPRLLTLSIPLNKDATPDVFFLELWEDEGVFLDGYAPKTVVLSANQADLVLCSACAYIAADYTEGGLKDFHITYSGQLIIDAIDPTPDTGRIQGSLNNLKMHAVTVDEAGQEVTEMGCKSTLEKITFDYPIVAAPVVTD